MISLPRILARLMPSKNRLRVVHRALLLPSIILLAICLQAGTASADKPPPTTPQAFFPLIRGGSGLPGKAYYVATNGDDSYPGTIDRPWRTIHKAARTLQAGEGVLIRGGTYTISSPIIPRNSGTPNRYIVFRGYPGEQVVVRGDGSTDTGIYIGGKSYIAIERLTVRNFQQGLNCQAPGHHIVIRDNVFEYNWRSGISSAGHVAGTKNACDYLTIEGNVVRHNGYHENGTPATGPDEGWGSGISINARGNPYAFDTDYSHFHSVIRGNRVYHNYDGTGGPDGDGFHLEGHGIIIDRGGNLPPMLIENNVVFDNGGKGIHLYGAQNVWIVGNTLYKNCTDPLFSDDHVNTQAEIAVYDVKFPNRLPTKNIHVLNNIACSNDPWKITHFPSVPSSELTMKNNLWCGNPYRETSSPYGTDYIRLYNPNDVKFINRSSADFHLQGDSPAIDQGTNSLQPGSQLVDFDGTTRPQGQGYDMGAYER